MGVRSDTKRVHGTTNAMNAKLLGWFCSIPEANRGSSKGRKSRRLDLFEEQCFVEQISSKKSSLTFSKFEIIDILNVINSITNTECRLNYRLYQ